MAEVTYAVRLAALLGAKILLVTNAAGGVNPSFSVGDFMLITDHLNFLGTNPLIGPNREEWGPRFPDMTVAYDKKLREIARMAACRLGVTLREGVYLAGTGPSYETPAEIRMARTLGADAVGMSTVPEVLVARHMGLKVLGLSVITNLAAGMSAAPLSHEEVREASERVREPLLNLLAALIGQLGKTV